MHRNFGYDIQHYLTINSVRLLASSLDSGWGGFGPLPPRLADRFPFLRLPPLPCALLGARANTCEGREGTGGGEA